MNDSDYSASDPLLVPTSSDEEDGPKTNHPIVSEGASLRHRGARSTESATRVKSLVIRWLKFYSKFLQRSPLHQDRLLKALQWTFWLASTLVASQHSTNKRIQAESSASNERKALSAFLAKLSTELSFARYVTRLFEFPTALEAVLTGSWAPSISSASPSLSRWIGRGLSWSMLGYYPTEYLSYFLWMLPRDQQTSQTNRAAARYAAVSCQFWVIYLVSDIVQHGQIVLWKPSQKSQDDGGDDDVKEARLKLLRSVLFLLPAIHYSLPQWDTKPWLPSHIVNGLMWAEAMISLYETATFFEMEPPE